MPLSDIENHRRIRRDYPGLAHAVAEISTPPLRNMGTIGGNVLLDTRCNYYDQNLEWRQAIDFCMKKDGAICWVAPGSPRCLAVQSADSVPILIALGARAVFRSPEGEREAALEELYRNDGIHYLTKRPEELLTEIRLPAPEGWRASYRKLRRRGSFDFPVLSVGAAVLREGERIVGGAPRPGRRRLGAGAPDGIGGAPPGPPARRGRDRASPRRPPPVHRARWTTRTFPFCGARR